MGVGVRVGVEVCVGVGPGVGVLVGVEVRVGVGEGPMVGVAVGVQVEVGTAVGIGALALMYPPALMLLGVQGYVLNGFAAAGLFAFYLVRTRAEGGRATDPQRIGSNDA